MANVLRSRQDVFRSIQPGPRLRLAARLYASGAVPTKRAACEAVGLSPNYLTVMNNNPEINNILGEIDKAINDETVSLSRVIALASRRAAAKMNQLIDSPNEHVALKASSDLLDRAPETSKTFKGVLTNFNFSPEDSRELAMALVASAKAKEKYLPIATGDFVKVDTNQESGNGKEEAGPPEGS